MDKKVKKIDDPRLKAYVNRLRSGITQIFYTGSDSRDFERYKREAGGPGHHVEMHDKPDTIRLTPPERHYHAQLIDGEWWWVNGCAECNGDPRDWMTYVECDKHDVCRTCGERPNEQRYGGKNGWQCSPCRDEEHERAKAEALAKMPEDEDFDVWDYEDISEMKCPYCNYEFTEPYEYAESNEEKVECYRCDNTFTVTAVPHIHFTTNRTD